MATGRSIVEVERFEPCCAPRKFWGRLAAHKNGTGAPYAVVLLYHAVGSTSPAVSQAQFRQQITWLARNTRVVDLDTIASGAWPESPTGVISAITFDDGYTGVHEFAMPVPWELKCPATVFVSTATIAANDNRSSNQYPGLYKNERLLSWVQLRELSQNGISVGSHLMNHEDLTTLSRADALRQLTCSKETIQQNVGAKCTSFAYPWGRFSESAVETVRESGYESAVVALHKVVRRPSLDAYRIPRTDIRHEYGFEDFKEVLRGNWDFLALHQWRRHYEKK